MQNREVLESALSTKKDILILSYSSKMFIMKNKHTLHRSIMIKILAPLIFFFTVIVFSGCHSEKKEATDWLNLSVTFKPGTSPEIREASLSAIERIIKDSIIELNKTFKDFNPPINRIRESASDSLSYTFKVPSGELVAHICTCESRCKICRNTKEAQVSPVPVPPFIVGDYLQNIETKNVDPKGNTGKN